MSKPWLLSRIADPNLGDPPSNFTGAESAAGVAGADAQGGRSARAPAANVQTAPDDFAPPTWPRGVDEKGRPKW